VACHYASLCPNDGRMPRRGAIQVCGERRPLSCVAKAQGPGEDQVGPGRGPHARTVGMQVRAMVVVQRDKGGGQTRNLVRN